MDLISFQITEEYSATWENAKLCSLFLVPFHSSMGNQQLIHTPITSWLNYRSILQFDLCMSLANHLQIDQKLAAGLHFLLQQSPFCFSNSLQVSLVTSQVKTLKVTQIQWIKSEKMLSLICHKFMSLSYTVSFSILYISKGCNNMILSQKTNGILS